MSALRSFRFPSSIFRRNALSHRYLSTVSGEKGTSGIPQWSLNDISTNATGLQFRDYFKTHFTAAGNEIYKARSGAFVPYTKAEVDTYLPEGLPFTRMDGLPVPKDGQWMARESSKLLCRLIDEWEKKLVKSTPSEPFTDCNVVPYARVEIPKFTDRKEWEDTKIKCFHFGEEVAKQFEKDPSVDFDGNSADLGGKYTLTEKVVKQIKVDSVQNILLTGMQHSLFPIFVLIFV